MISVETSTDDSNYTTHANYIYYERGVLKRVELASINGTPLQGIDYVYNINGQLKSINHPILMNGMDPGGDNDDVFGMLIDYHQNDYARTQRSNITTSPFGTDQYNGNIKTTRWNTSTYALPSPKENSYNYQYNKNNWLEDATYGEFVAGNTTNTSLQADIISTVVITSGNTLALEATNSITLQPGFHAQPGSDVTAKIYTITSFNQLNAGDYNVNDITYDANGNIKTLTRNKQTENGSNQMDDFTYLYKYGKNQLDHVDDAVTATTNADDLKDQSNSNYIYNSIGQLIQGNENGDVFAYTYNASGLVTEIKKNSLPLVKFFYNDRGHRVKKEVYNSGGSLTRTDYYVRDASGSVMAIYEKPLGGSDIATEYPIYGVSRLGIFNRVSDHSVYQLTDHLGNVRAVVERDSNNNTVALVTTDYYPGGMAMPNRNIVGDYRYNYQGNFSEKDKEIGLNSFERRFYDARLMRWLTPDDIKRSDQSPYIGMGNNPILYGDPDGRDIIILNSSMAVGGLGHAAVLIGNDVDGWRYISKNGTDHKLTTLGGLLGPNRHPDLGNETYDSNTGEGNDFRGTGLTATQVMRIVNKQYMDAHPDGERYDNYIRVKTTTDQDNLAYNAAFEEANSYYSVFGTSCVDVPQNALMATQKAFKNPGFNNIFPNDWFINFGWFNNNTMYNRVPGPPKVTIEVGPLQQGEIEY